MDESNRLISLWLPVSVSAGVLRWRPATKSVFCGANSWGFGRVRPEVSPSWAKQLAGGTWAVKQYKNHTNQILCGRNRWWSFLIGIRLSEFSLFSVTSNFSYRVALRLCHRYLPTSIFKLGSMCHLQHRYFWTIRNLYFHWNMLHYTVWNINVWCK